MSWYPILNLKQNLISGKINTLLNENVVFETSFSDKEYIVILTPQFQSNKYYVGELTEKGFKINGDKGIYFWLVVPITT
jgi:hypothetical protein